MLNKLFGPALHEHPEAAQRVAGIAALPPDSKVLGQLLVADPDAEVRAAAAARSEDAAALGAALQSEAEPSVRSAIVVSLGKALAALADDGQARVLLAAPQCTDAVRAEVAIHTLDDGRWRLAIEGIGDEATLVDVALAAARAPVRLAAAERVHAPEQLRRLADGARDKDRGVARIARQRLDAIAHRTKQVATADEILAQAEELAAQPGAIVMAAVELDRRWKALELGDDAPRRERWDAIERRMQERFEREHNALRAHAQFAQRLDSWLASLHSQPAAGALPALRETLLALRAEAQGESDAPALEKLAQAEQQITRWEQAVPVLEAAAALVVEAEQLAHAAPAGQAEPRDRARPGDRAPRRSQPAAGEHGEPRAKPAPGEHDEPPATQPTPGDRDDGRTPPPEDLGDSAEHATQAVSAPASAQAAAADPGESGMQPVPDLGETPPQAPPEQPSVTAAPPTPSDDQPEPLSPVDDAEPPARAAPTDGGALPAEPSPQDRDQAQEQAIADDSGPSPVIATDRDNGESQRPAPAEHPAPPPLPPADEGEAGQLAQQAPADDLAQPEPATLGDESSLLARWQALPLAARTPALTRRFEAALLAIEHRRLEQARAAQQYQGATRQHLHARLHDAEQALVAGHLQEARTAVNEARSLRPAAGQLPKPTIQRLGRVTQQLGELERWQKFGSQTAHIQLCERAEALAQRALTPAALAREVQQLRAEWKKLDAGNPGAPKPLWERFDAACEKAYAPAARHFAELATQHKQARKLREEFIAATEAKAPELLAEPRDWRALERWLREVDGVWHGATLGSVEPGAWKRLDARFKAAVAPARAALSGERGEAKAGRQALIAEAQALAAMALDREAPSQVRALQERWQQQAKARSLQQRDERALWEQFRAACNAVFDARKSLRKEADERKGAQRRTFATLNEQLEQLAQSDEADEAALRRGRHELQEQWKKAAAENGPVPAALEARFKSARGAIEETLRRRARAQETAVWRTLLAKERLCEELDALVPGEPDAQRAEGLIESVRRRWDELPALAAAWERAVQARREAAERALRDDDARWDLADAIEAQRDERRDALLEIELQLGLESPADLQPQRLAVQVKQLRNRFKSAPASADASVDKLLLAWCAAPGTAPERDHQRCERIVASFERRR